MPVYSPREKAGKPLKSRGVKAISPAFLPTRLGEEPCKIPDPINGHSLDPVRIA